MWDALARENADLVKEVEEEKKSTEKLKYENQRLSAASLRMNLQSTLRVSSTPNNALVKQATALRSKSGPGSMTTRSGVTKSAPGKLRSSTRVAKRIGAVAS